VKRIAYQDTLVNQPDTPNECLVLRTTKMRRWTRSLGPLPRYHQFFKLLFACFVFRINRQTILFFLPSTCFFLLPLQLYSVLHCCFDSNIFFACHMSWYPVYPKTVAWTELFMEEGGGLQQIPECIVANLKVDDNQIQETQKKKCLRFCCLALFSFNRNDKKL